MGLGWLLARCAPWPGREATGKAQQGSPSAEAGPCHVSPESSPKLREPSGRVGGSALLNPPPSVSGRYPPRSTEPHPEPSSLANPHCQQQSGGACVPGPVEVEPRPRPGLPLETSSAPLMLTLGEGCGEDVASWGVSVKTHISSASRRQGTRQSPFPVLGSRARSPDNMWPDGEAPVETPLVLAYGTTAPHRLGERYGPGASVEKGAPLRRGPEAYDRDTAGQRGHGDRWVLQTIATPVPPGLVNCRLCVTMEGHSSAQDCLLLTLHRGPVRGARPDFRHNRT